MANERTIRFNAAESLTATIVEKVSDRENVDPTSLPPLHDVVDPDALETVFATTNRESPRNDGRVEFTYCGYEVTVGADGRVVVVNAEDGDRTGAHLDE